MQPHKFDVDILVKGKLIKENGTDLQFLMADGSTKTLEEFNYISVTKTELDNLVNTNSLIAGALYKISGVDSTLYGNITPDNEGGTTIYVQAMSANQVSLEGFGIFYTPKYDQQIGGYGIFDKTGQTSYATNESVIWGGRYWSCVNTSNGFNNVVVDVYNLDTNIFQPVAFNPTDFNIQLDSIKYDYINDKIVYRNEKNVNVVDFSYENFIFLTALIDYGNLTDYYNPIRIFQWGNRQTTDYDISSSPPSIDYRGIGNQKIENSVNANLNFAGKMQYNIKMTRHSWQTDCNFYGDSLQANIELNGVSNIRNLTLINANQVHVKLDNNSSLYNLTIDGQRQINISLIEFYWNRNGQIIDNEWERDIYYSKGVKNFTSYGQGNVTGNPTYNLSVDENGKVIETSIPKPTQVNLQSYVKLKNLQSQVNLSLDNNILYDLTISQLTLINFLNLPDINKAKSITILAKSLNNADIYFNHEIKSNVVYKTDGIQNRLDLKIYNDSGVIKINSVIHYQQIIGTNNIPPIISLNGENPQEIEAENSYIEQGAVTNDGSTIVIDSTNVNTNVVGTYQVTYNSTGSNGAEAIEVVRTVNVVDTTPPSTPTITNTGQDGVDITPPTTPTITNITI